MNALNQIDLWFATFAHTVCLNFDDIFTPLLRALSVAGNSGAIFIAISVVMLAFRRTRKAGCTALVALAAGVLITELLLKNIVGRARPFTDETSLFYTYWADAGRLSASGYSFPSGHTAAAAAFATAMFLHFKKKISWLFFSIPLAMGFSRVYFQVHYITDVAAALVIDFLCGLLATYAVKLLLKLSFFKKFIDAGSITVR